MESSRHQRASYIDSSNYGWNYTDNITPSPSYGVKEVAPVDLLKVVACGCAAEPVCSKTCSCKLAGISCTTYCKCEASMDRCVNPFTTQTGYDDTESESDDSDSDDDMD